MVTWFVAQAELKQQILQSQKSWFSNFWWWLQDKNIDYDIKIACFNSKSLIGNGLVLPAGPLREQIKNIKNYDAAIINGNGENISKFKKYLKSIDKNLRIFEGRYLPDKKVKKLQKKIYSFLRYWKSFFIPRHFK